MDILISICIPTFNRATLLKKSLARLLFMSKKFSCVDQIEICISNNASNDETEEVIGAYMHFFPNFNAVNLQKNVSFGDNLKNVVKLAKGKRLVFFGDDDLILNSTFPLLFKFVETSYPLVIFDSNEGHKNLSDIEIYEIINSENMLRKLGIFHLTNLTNFMVDRQVFMSHIDIMDTRSAYPHTQILFSLVSKYKNLYVKGSILEVDGKYRDWKIWQPIFSSFDMAKILNDVLFKNEKLPFMLKFSCYSILIRSIPRSVLLVKNSNISIPSRNPYREVSFKNVGLLYSSNILSQIIALSAYSFFKFMPFRITKLLLKIIGGNANFPKFGAKILTSFDK